MKLHPSLVAGALLLALAACRPGAAEYTESEAPKHLTLDNASTHTDLRFAPGSSRLLAGEVARLRALAATGAIAPSDRVRVAVASAGSPALAAARFETIAAELLRYRIAASARPLAALAPNRALIESERYLVSAPPCPNWSKQSSLDFTNTLSSNHGCANAVNLGQIVATPADLAEGRPVGLAMGQPAAAAVRRYLNDEVKLPTATVVGPIGAPSSQAPGAGGAGDAGSKP